MTPIVCFLISSGSKMKETRYVCLIEAKASHLHHKMWTEGSSLLPHFLQVGLLLIPIIYRCLIKVLCPVSRSITTLDCVLLKNNNRAPVARLGSEIDSNPASVYYTDHDSIPDAGFPFSLLFFAYILPRDPQEGLRSNRPLNRTVPCELVGDFISSH